MKNLNLLAIAILLLCILPAIKSDLIKIIQVEQTANNFSSFLKNTVNKFKKLAMDIMEAISIGVRYKPPVYIDLIDENTPIEYQLYKASYQMHPRNEKLTPLGIKCIEMFHKTITENEEVTA